MTIQDLISTVDKHEYYIAWAALHERRADRWATALHGAADIHAASVAAQQYSYHSGYADALRAVARDAAAETRH